MEQNQNLHELNGYKFSFNRVNPYLSSQDKQSCQYQSQSIHQKQPQKQPHLTTPSSNPIYKSTKHIFYKKQNETEKNKVLADLYLRKTKFNKMKQAEKRIDGIIHAQKTNNYSFNSTKNDLHSKKQNQNNTSQLHIDVSNLTQTKQQTYEGSYDQRNERLASELIQSNHKKLHLSIGVTSTNSKIGSSLRIQQTPQQFVEEVQDSCKDSEVKKQPKTIKKRKSQKHPNYKIYRNFSQNKFNPYLAVSSPKNHSKIKHQKSGTTPIFKETKVQKSVSLLKLLTTEETAVNPMLTSQSSLQKKQNKKFLTELKIKPQKHDDPNEIHTNFYKLTSPRDSLHPSNKLQPLKLQNLKSANQQLTNKKHLGLLGHIKYKSPRMILSSRNQLFKSRNQPPKIKLFTQEEESNIIQEFYSQEKDLKK